MKRKLLSLIFCVCIISALGVSSSAAELSMAPPNQELVFSSSNTLPSASDIQTFAWGGTAAQVTRIEWYNHGWLSNGNFAIILKVTGYGNDQGRCFFGGKAVASKYDGYFINYGNTADGFFYLYDCGPITEPGTYEFITTFKSTNWPYRELTYKDTYVFSPVE